MCLNINMNDYGDIVFIIVIRYMILYKLVSMPAIC